MQENSNQNLMQEALRLAATPQGQQLLALLQQKGGEGLRGAMDQASEGNYDAAKKELSKLLKDPKMKQLLDSLGR